MARAMKFAAVLVCGASALTVDQTMEQQAQELFGGHPAVLGGTFNEFTDLFPLTEGRVNSTKYLITDVFKKYGSVISNLLEMSADGSGSCSASDFRTFRDAITGKASLMDFAHDSCAPDAINSPDGFDYGLMASCLQESNKITAPCQSCFIDLAKKVIGDKPTVGKGCNRRCVLWSAWCQDGPREFCNWFISECYDCARQPMSEFLQCVGTANQDTLMSAYDDVANFAKSKPTKTQYGVADMFVNAYPLDLLSTPFIEPGSVH